MRVRVFRTSALFNYEYSECKWLYAMYQFYGYTLLLRMRCSTVGYSIVWEFRNTRAGMPGWKNGGRSPALHTSLDSRCDECQLSFSLFCRTRKSLGRAEWIDSRELSRARCGLRCNALDFGNEQRSMVALTHKRQQGSITGQEMLSLVLFMLSHATSFLRRRGIECVHRQSD